MNYSVDYNSVFLLPKQKAKRVPVRGDACFSSIYRYSHDGKYSYDEKYCPDFIEYHGNVREKSDHDTLKWYCEFLKTWLLPGSFKYRITDDATRVLFILRTKGMSRACALMHLTAFRYIDEFWVVLKPFIKACKGKKVDDDLRFRIFIAINYLKCDQCYNMGGHGLIYKGYGVKYGKYSQKAVLAFAQCCPTIEQVRALTKTAGSVQSHFPHKPLNQEAINNHEPDKKEEADNDDWV